MAFEIPQSEFEQRIAAVQAELARRNLDALIVFGNDCESHNIRYLADYWPAFESAGVLVPVEGDPVLLIGPESLTYARTRSRIPTIRQLLAYRESSEPEYPGVKLPSFSDVFDEVTGGKGIKRLGVAASAITSVPVYLGLQEAMAGGEMVKSDDLLISLRMRKSENEIAAIREAFRVAALAMKAVVEEMRPGMTELQVVGIAQPTHRQLVPGEVIQLNIGAKVGGYTSSIGRAVSFGPVPDDVRRLLQVALDAEKRTIELIRPGVSAGWISQQVADYVAERGMGHALLYGPCHGIGLMECEHPWMETSSTYELVPNMTFQVDSFLHTDEYGARFEDGVLVTEEGAEEFPTYRRELIVL
jgi:Xaa-Pro aminopeptidase